MTAKQRSSDPSEEAFDAFLRTAHRLADLAGQAILPHFRQPVSIENKAVDGGFDPVTDADRAAEQTIRKELALSWPGHGVFGEEYGSHNPEAAYTWIIDPIDGTRSFLLGSPLWGTLIGLQADTSPVLGLMDQPFTKERFWSDTQQSFMRSGTGDAVALRTRSCPSLDQASLSTTHPDLFGDGFEQDGFAALKSRVKMCRFGGDCYAYGLLAAGFIDIIVEAGLKPYDIVALIPIIERAGGTITTWTGEPAMNGGCIVATGDEGLHAQALKVLQG